MLIPMIQAPADSIVIMVTDSGKLLAGTWSDIRRRNAGQDIPQARVMTTSGRGSLCGSVEWDKDPVIILDAATMAGGPEAVLAALLHQAAHSIAGVSASSEGRYHGKAYRDAALAVGLDVPAAVEPGLGFGRTSLTNAARGSYAATLKRLADLPAVTPRTAARGKVSAHCQCSPPRNILMAASTLAGAPILCDACGQPFAV